MQIPCRAPALPSAAFAAQLADRMGALVLGGYSAGEVYRMIQIEFPNACPELIHQCADALLSKED